MRIKYDNISIMVHHALDCLCNVLLVTCVTRTGGTVFGFLKLLPSRTSARHQTTVVLQRQILAVDTPVQMASVIMPRVSACVMMDTSRTTPD